MADNVLQAPDPAREAPPATQPSATSWASAHWLGWGAILLVALIWRLLGITTTEVWRDEATTIIQARGHWLDLLVRLPKVEDTPPLMFLLFKAWSLICDREWFLRLLPALLGVAWVDVTMRTARSMCPRAWWAAGLLAAFSQVPIHYSQEIRGYSLLLLLTGLCFWAAERACRAESSRLWLFALAGLGALTAHCHMAGVFVFPATVVFLLVRAGGQRRSFLQITPLILWCAAVTPLVWYARYWSVIRQSDLDAWWIPAITWRRSAAIAANFLGLGPLAEFPISLQTPWAMWSGYAAERVILFGCFFLALLGILNPHTRKRMAALVAGAAAMLCLLLVSGYVSLPNVLDRTVLPAWSPLVLALGIGASGGQGKQSRTAAIGTVIAIAVLWAAGWAWMVYEGPPRRPPTQELFARVAHRIAPADLIYTSPRWFKEMVVYRLQDRISADQLLDEYESYTGKPPRHRLQLSDPRRWPERFAEKIAARRRLYGLDFNVWLVRWGSLGAVQPDNPDQFIMSEFRETERHETFLDRPVTIVRYRPKTPAGESRPAASTGE